jgi:hypothetical protein
MLLSQMSDLRRISDLSTDNRIKQLYTASILTNQENKASSTVTSILKFCMSPLAALFSKPVLRSNTVPPAEGSVRPETLMAAAALLKLIAEAVKSCLCAVDGIHYDSRSWSHIAADRNRSASAALLSATTTDALVLECRRRCINGREVKEGLLALIGAARLAVADADTAIRGPSDAAAAAALAPLAAFLHAIADCREIAAASGAAPPPPNELAAALQATAAGSRAKPSAPAAAAAAAEGVLSELLGDDARRRRLAATLRGLTLARRVGCGGAPPRRLRWARRIGITGTAGVLAVVTVRPSQLAAHGRTVGHYVWTGARTMLREQLVEPATAIYQAGEREREGGREGESKRVRHRISERSFSPIPPSFSPLASCHARGVNRTPPEHRPRARARAREPTLGPAARDGPRKQPGPASRLDAQP